MSFSSVYLLFDFSEISQRNFLMLNMNAMFINKSHLRIFTSISNNLMKDWNICVQPRFRHFN